MRRHLQAIDSLYWKIDSKRFGQRQQACAYPSGGNLVKLNLPRQDGFHHLDGKIRIGDLHD
jgi:hypothetical protein